MSRGDTEADENAFSVTTGELPVAPTAACDVLEGTNRQGIGCRTCEIAL